MLEVEGVSKRYASLQILKDLSLVCARGRIVCLAGANATGKTTLLSIIAGLQKADTGVVRCDAEIGFVPQENAQMSDLTVRDNLMLWYSAFSRKEPVFSEGSPEKEMGLAPFATKRVSALSGGIKKRTAIACALACNPGYLLMDEPFAALDLTGKNELIQLLRVLKSRNVGILFSSHDPSSVARLADEVLLLTKGCIKRRLDLDSMQGDGNENLQQKIAAVISLLSEI